MKAELPRDIYAEGEATVRSFILLMVAFGVLFGLVTMVLLSRLVVSRLTKLSKEVATVGTPGNLSMRLQATGNDEVSTVVARINDMLSSLEESQKDLRHSEEKLRLVFQSLEEGITVTDLEGNIIEA